MAKSDTYDRHINIWINGKEVENSAKAIKREMLNLSREVNGLIIGTKEYNQKVAELKRVKGIIEDHSKSLRNTGTAWDRLKKLAEGGLGKIMAGVGVVMGAYHSIKGIIESTDALGDKWEATLGGWKSGLDAINRAIATMDFKNFGKNIREAIEEGRRYVEKQDEINDRLRSLRMNEADVASELLKLRAIENDSTKTTVQRIEAGKKAIKLEEDMAKIRTDIANETYQNELTNAAKITGESEKTVENYIKQEKVLMQNLEAGKKYVDLQTQYNNQYSMYLKKAAAGAPNANDFLDAANKIKAQMDAMGSSAQAYGTQFTNLGKLIDDKKDKIVAAYQAVKDAETSNLQNTMKIMTKTNTLEGGQIDKEKEFFAERIKMRKALIDVENELRDYFDKMDRERSAKWQQETLNIDERIKFTQGKMLEDLNNRSVIEQGNILAKFDFEKQQNEIRRRQEVEGAEKTGADVALINEKYAKLEEQIEFQKQQSKLSIAANFFGNMATIFGKQTALGKAAAIAETTINTYAAATAAYKAMADIPVVGPALGVAAAAAAVAAGLMNVRQIIAVNTDKIGKKMWTGGYSGAGGKYEPKGIVHGGEWVASAAMVSSPVTGPVISALEGYRTMGQYANGGPVGRKGSGSSPLLGSDPEMKALIAGVGRLLVKLDKEGVKTHWGYRDVDNVRKRLTRLEEVEKDVRM